MRIFVLFFFLLTTASSFSQSSNALFEEANKLYNEGDYEGAIQKYHLILENKVHSAALYYNLANAHYKLNHVAPTIYYYEKALLLAPNDEDIKVNISFAKNMTLDAIEVLPQSSFSRIVEKSRGRFTYNDWAKISIGFIFLFVITFLLYYFSVRQGKKRLFFIISTIAIIFCVASVVFAYQEYNSTRNDRPAIIFAIESNVKSEPNNRSENIFLLHEGTKVNVLDLLGDWHKIRLSDGKTGWIPKEDLKELKVF